VRLDDKRGELLLENESESRVTLASDVKTESGQAAHVVGGTGVVSEIGSGKVEVTVASVRVNNGALEVI
jgi:hypothetical protein